MIGLFEITVFERFLHDNGFTISAGKSSRDSISWTATHTSLPGNYFLVEVDESEEMYLESKVGSLITETKLAQFDNLDALEISMRIVSYHLHKSRDTNQLL